MEELKAKLPARHLKLFNMEVSFMVDLLKCSKEEAEAKCINKWLNIDKVASDFKY
jgi:hypothetical protein